MMDTIQNTGVSVAAPTAGSGGSFAKPPLTTHHSPLTTPQWGMAAFLASEAAFFCTLISVYLAFLGADKSGPTPAVLSLRLVVVTTVCLLSSSVTVHLAEKSLRSGSRSAFLRWWSATILLGTA